MHQVNNISKQQHFFSVSSENQFLYFTIVSGNCECGCGKLEICGDFWWVIMIVEERSASLICLCFVLSLHSGEWSGREQLKTSGTLRTWVCAIRYMIESCWLHIYFRIVSCTARKQVWVWHSKVHSLHNPKGLRSYSCCLCAIWRLGTESMCTASCHVCSWTLSLN